MSGELAGLVEKLENCGLGYQHHIDLCHEAAAALRTLSAGKAEAEAKWVEADEGEKVAKEFLDHADARVDTLQAEVTRLTEALEPFANLCEFWSDDAPDSYNLGGWVTTDDWEREHVPKLSMARRARAAIEAARQALPLSEEKTGG